MFHRRLWFHWSIICWVKKKKIGPRFFKVWIWVECSCIVRVNYWLISIWYYKVSFARMLHVMNRWCLPFKDAWRYLYRAVYTSTIFIRHIVKKHVLAHLSWRLKVSHCDWSLPVVRPFVNFYLLYTNFHDSSLCQWLNSWIECDLVTSYKVQDFTMKRAIIVFPDTGIYL